MRTQGNGQSQIRSLHAERLRASSASRTSSHTQLSRPRRWQVAGRALGLMSLFWLGLPLGGQALSGCSGGDDPGFGHPDTSPTPISDDSTVIITEVMANPEGVGDSDGEWIEIYNPGISEIDLTGWTIIDASGASITIDDGVLDGKHYMVLGNNNKNQTNGGVTVDYAYDASFTLSNESESLTLANAAGLTVDTISYSKSPKGASLSLDPTRYDVKLNDRTDSFCASQYSALESGDYGTPGKLNDVCFVSAEVGALVITEIMANPLAVSDDRGEYLEIYNTTANEIQLDGWVVKDGAGDTHTIASGGALSIAARSYLVLASHAETTENGGVQSDYTYNGALIFDDEADTISLYAGSTLVDAVAYGSTGFDETPVGASLQLDSGSLTSTANDDGGNWCPATTTISGGTDKGSPGSVNETCP